jgi:hypothetical protein
VLTPKLLVPYPETFTRREAEYPDLALMEVAMDRQNCFRGLIKGEYL